MKGSFKYKNKRGLPGGPNEQFTYVTGMFSTEGYKRNSPDVNNPFNIIPSGNITMKGVDFPVLGVDNLGNSKMMQPGKDYKFPGNTVFEIPVVQKGGESNNKEYWQAPIPRESNIESFTNSYLSTTNNSLSGIKDSNFREQASRIINSYDSLPNDTSYIYLTPTDNYFYNTGQNTQDGKPVQNYQGNGTLDNKFYQDKIKALIGYAKGGEPQYQRGGEPIYVTDRNDPRYKAYQDSLSLYNSGASLNQLKDILDQTNVYDYIDDKEKIIEWLKKYNGNTDILPQAILSLDENKLKEKYKSDEGAIYMRLPDGKGGFVPSVGAGSYRKPKQPVIYKPWIKPPDINLEGLIKRNIKTLDTPPETMNIRQTPSRQYKEEDGKYYMRMPLSKSPNSLQWRPITKRTYDLKPQYQSGGEYLRNMMKLIEDN